MVIALLAVLGVDLIVIVVLLGAVLARRRWVSHQPGTFKSWSQKGSGGGGILWADTVSRSASISRRSQYMP
jgi:hypothetical protein